MRKYYSIISCIALLFLLTISGCGKSTALPSASDSVVHENNDTTSTEKQVQTQELTSQTEQTNTDTNLKYSSLTPYSLGKVSEFTECFENKLQLILDVDDFKLEKKERKFNAQTQTGDRGCTQTVSHYTFSGCGGEEGGGLYFEITIYHDDGGIFEQRGNERPELIKSMTIKPHYKNLSDGYYKEITKPVLANADESTFEKNICAWLMPIAVFEDFNSKEELLAQYEKYETKINTPKEYIGKKIMTDKYISYSQYNEKTGWINFSSANDAEQKNKYDTT